ncbi:uncharacterized protein LOC115532442 [Gadus morhua]|uniref:uncharacterized protein LOC115532442 n=1 Tax=Gadus morhua TaxID=8049 RepID=UPI0011B61AA7|nr:uncharacterized protein LOC115532442 [Gadus morhua]
MQMQEMENIQSQLKNLEVITRLGHAKAAYGTIEQSINTAWNEYEKLKERNDVSEMKKYFDDYESSHANHNLFQLYSLMPKKVSLFGSLPNTFIEESRCHNAELDNFNRNFNDLMVKSLVLNVRLFRYKGDELNKGKIVEAVHYYHDGMRKLYKAQWICFDHDTTYIELDLQDEMITQSNTEADNIAAAITKHLSEAYSSYDWYVVVHKTTYDILTYLQKHTLSEEFIMKIGPALTVAAAQQIRGSHTKVSEIVLDIKKCLSRGQVVCSSLNKKFKSCELLDKFTVIHYYRYLSNSGKEKITEAESDPVVDSVDNTEGPYIYKGTCSSTSHFIVMIKSDEEILNANRCSPTLCQNGGQCKALFARTVCDCKYPYHGDKCEWEIVYPEKDVVIVKKKDVDEAPPVPLRPLNRLLAKASTYIKETQVRR